MVKFAIDFARTNVIGLVIISEYCFQQQSHPK